MDRSFVMGYTSLLNWARSIFRGRRSGRYRLADRLPAPAAIARSRPSGFPSETPASHDDLSTITFSDIQA